MNFKGSIIMLVKDNHDCIHLYKKKSKGSNPMEKYLGFLEDVQKEHNLVRAYVFEETHSGYNYMWGTSMFRDDLNRELGHNERKYISYLHEHRPDILLRSPYKSKRRKSLHLCSKGHEFLQTPSAIMEGKKCPKCKILSQESKGGKFITEVLAAKNIEFVRGVSMRRLGCENDHRLDFLIVENNLPLFAIEFHGIQHYKIINREFFGGREGYKKRVERDKIKRVQSWKAGIPLIEIPYTEGENEIESTIEYFLGLYGLDKRSSGRR